jgi:hypothetical protein
LALSTLQRQFKRRGLENGEAKAWGELSLAENRQTPLRQADWERQDKSVETG